MVVRDEELEDRGFHFLPGCGTKITIPSKIINFIHKLIFLMNLWIVPGRRPIFVHVHELPVYKFKRRIGRMLSKRQANDAQCKYHQ
jgi:hypothetical protein